MTFFKSSALLLGFFLSTAALAADDATAKLEQFVENVETFSAHFEQMVIDAEGNLLEEAE
jgi:outer membrane lipoprotein-sorting protein